MIVIYTDKPMISRKIAPFFSEKYQNEIIVYIHSMYFMNVYFDYSNNIKWKDFPIISNPQFKISSIEKWRAVTYENEKLIPIEVSFQDIKNCQKLIYAGDYCSSNIYLFSEFLSYLFGDLTQQENIDFLCLKSLSDNSIVEAIENSKSFHDVSTSIFNEGRIRKYFDYNFNLNSFALFGKSYQCVMKEFHNINTHNTFISKNMLQLLYFVKNEQNNSIIYKEGQLISKMYNWKGTGKYQFKSSIGNEASRISIIQNLIDLELIEVNNQYIFISLKGKKFLEFLPKDCMDYDLPFRINLWSKLPFDEAKNKIDNYLSTYYKKIKNKLNNK